MSDPADLYSAWIKPGDLVFDIGAYVGLRTAVFLAMGARVVAVEPQEAMAAQIPPHERLRIMQCAVSSSATIAELYVAPGHEYVSTIEHEYLAKVQTHAAYAYTVPIQVATVMLDDIISTFGVPAFCKIDVEGHERAVFDGLTTALPALSFEVHDFDLEKADYCIASLNTLGEYAYSFSPRESFELQPWPAKVDVFGDIYAVRQ